MKINKLVREENCLILTSGSKTEAILELIERIEQNGSVADTENLKKEIFYREQIMSTGIGQGLAVPHVRFEGVSDPVILFGISPGGISDYESIDGAAVKIVVMIIVGAEQHREYLRILSLAVHKLKDKTFQENLLNAAGPAEMAALLGED